MAAPWRPTVFSTRHGDLLNSLDQLTVQLHADPRSRDPNVSRLDDAFNDVNDNYILPLADINLKAGSKILVDRMHTHPDGYVRNADATFIAALEQYLGNLAVNDQGRQNVEKLLSYWYGANSLKRLDRFLDHRQPPLAALPAFTGWNVGGPPANPTRSPDIHWDWQFRRLLIRCLHFPGLTQLDTDPNSPNLFLFERFGHFVDLYCISRSLLELEHQNTQELDPVEFPHKRTDPHRWDLDWIKRSRSIIDGALQQMFDTTKVPIGPVVAMAQAAQVANTPMSNDDVAQANISMAHLQLMRAIQDQMDATMRQNPFERLVLDLLDKENTFERLLSVEHVDDKLINKQISLLDEENVVQGPRTVDELDSMHGGSHDNTILKLLQDVSFVNRQRRNWRLFKDWSPGHRPWRQMYQMYDSSQPGGAWLGAAVPLFLQRTQPAPLANQRGHPTDYFTLGPKLFDLQPYDLATQSGFGCFLCRLPFGGYPGPSIPPPTPGLPRDGMNKAFDANSPLAYTVTVLHCGHIYHTTCIFKYWDMESRYTHSCKECGSMAKLNWDLVALPPLEFDPPYNPNVPGSGPTNIFAHNTFAHRRAELLFPKTTGPPPRGRAGDFETRDDKHKDLFVAAMYNIPSKDQSRLVRGPAYTDNRGTVYQDKIAVQYWMRENMLAAEYAMHPIQWNAVMFEPGELNTMRSLEPAVQTAFDLNDLEASLPPGDEDYRRPRGVSFTAAQLQGGDQILGRSGWRAIGRELGNRYMASVERNSNPLDPHYRSVYDVDQRRDLQESRFLPQVEAAELRRRRRARNQRRRMAIRAAGQGIETPTPPP
ncbi:uncharacterized protein PAC_02258 [Phialocephala subalpina]|uniref:Uncharacterized protein n=1 Tax=Phialocephala subalpina TaxID=576137 RepID=A0A1L7WHZ3_9HELO|nr:uncharacterized protein PAC_02258 [Phialocephala subalpina]